MIKNKLQQNKTIPFFCAVLTCMLVLSACKKDQPTAAVSAPVQPAKVAPAQTRPIQKPNSSALRLPPPANQFDFSSKKDPFKPFVMVKAPPVNSSATTRKALRDALPIHSFEVSQFKLIGIITGGRENQAMVTDPGGKGYVLKVGTTIGKNDGKVASITSSGVDVLEQFRDDNGRVRKEKIKLTLPRKQ